MLVIVIIVPGLFVVPMMCVCLCALVWILCVFNSRLKVTWELSKVGKMDCISKDIICLINELGRFQKGVLEASIVFLIPW